MFTRASMPISLSRDPLRIVRSESGLGGSPRRPKRERPLRNARLDPRPRPGLVRPVGIRVDIRA